MNENVDDENFSWHFPVHVTSRKQNSGTCSLGSQLNTPTKDSTYRVEIEETLGSVVGSEPELEPAHPEHTNDLFVDASCEPEAGVRT